LNIQGSQFCDSQLQEMLVVFALFILITDLPIRNANNHYQLSYLWQVMGGKVAWPI
jgi:hypothetical protein